MRTHIFLAVIAAALTASGCGSSASSPQPQLLASANAVGITLASKLLSATGGELPANQTVHVHVLAAGTNLFTEAGADCLHDPYTPGVYDKDLASDAQGQLSLSFALHDMVSAVDTSCPMNASARVGQLDRLEIQLSIAADADSCASLCSTIQGAAEANCQSSCVSGDRKLMSNRTYSHSDLVTQDMAAQGGVARLSLSSSFASAGFPIRATGNLPDLIVDGEAAASSWHVSTETFAPTDCAVVEGCIVAGTRRVLRFDGTFMNAGTGDFILGSPVDNPLFTFSSCHNHYHLKGIMLYELLQPGTLTPVSGASGQAVGRKQGFCAEDFTLGAGFNDSKYDCDSQGLSPGWEDVYDSSLDCQWIDVTGVPPGNYILRITVNPDGAFPEADRSNNSAEVPVTIPASGG